VILTAEGDGVQPVEEGGRTFSAARTSCRSHLR
jgi:hypothetical protein